MPPPDTTEVDWTAGARIDVFLDEMGIEPIDTLTDTIVYPPFLSVNGMKLTLPYGEGFNLPAERTAFQYDWPFWILLSCFAIIAMLRFAFPRRMRQLTYSIGGERFLHSLMREGQLFEERISLGLLVVFGATTGLLIKIILDQYFQFDIPWAPDWLMWSLFTLGVLFWWSFRVILIRLIGDVFGTLPATQGYLVRNLTFSLMQGVILTLLLPLQYYSAIPWILPAILVLLLLLHAYRILRNVISGISETGYGIQYQLLFVISVEILPLALLARLLSFPLS